jgi:hypothetical protein
MSNAPFKPKSPSPYQKRKPKDGLEWYEKEDLIHGCGLSHQVKHLLLVIKRSINDKKGTCWLSQPQLAEKMGVSVDTVQRAFYAAVDAGVISNERVRTGKGKYKQTNEYYIVWDKLRGMSTPQNDVSRMSPDDMSTPQNKPSTPQNGDEHTANTPLSTPQGAVSGLEFKVSNEGKQPGEQGLAGAFPAPSTAQAKSTAPSTPSFPTGTPLVPPVPPSGLPWSEWQHVGSRECAFVDRLQARYGGLKKFAHFQESNKTWFDIVRHGAGWRARKAITGFVVEDI